METGDISYLSGQLGLAIIKISFVIICDFFF